MFSSKSPPHENANIQTAAVPQRLKNYESWVEISSQPSSSSISSDEILTTGLRVQQDPNSRRRRRNRDLLYPSPHEGRGTSSQEEYEESESEEDHVLTSSNEHVIHIGGLDTRPAYDAESDSESDENATCLGLQTDAAPAFTPQRNAFSHPPSNLRYDSTPIGHLHPHSTCAKHIYSSRNVSRQHHNSPADHDAALRASLTTLLSIGAAAARGLPKREHSATGTFSRNEPMGLRFVSEAELMSPSVPPKAENMSRTLSPGATARTSPSIASQEPAGEKGKRKANTGEKVRALKKKRTQEVENQEAMISPTVLTWVVSAGVVVLVSVVGFGAGYVIGREVGKQEALAGLNGSTITDSGTCGREVIRSSAGGLRRFRWSIGGGSRGIIA